MFKFTVTDVPMTLAVIFGSADKPEESGRRLVPLKRWGSPASTSGH